MTRDLRLLAAAVFLSAAGDLLVLVVLALEVHEATGSALAVSALLAATLVPAVVLAPAAGLLADRAEAARVLVVASLAQAALAAGLAVAVDLPAILVLVALLAAGNAAAQPAEFALVPVAAGPDRLARATGAVEAARAAGCAAGPVAAAGLAVAGAEVALAVAAGCFAAVAALGAALRVRRTPSAARARERALDGARLLRDDAVLRPTVLAATGALLLLSITLTAEVVYVREELGASGTAYALLVAGWMAGMVAGAAALAPRVPAPALAPAALAVLAVQGLGIAGQTAVPLVATAAAGFVLGGVAHGAKNALLRTLLAARVPDALHGRAFAAYNAARTGAELGAVALGGVLVTVLGPRAALAVAGAWAVVAALGGLLALRARGGRPVPVPA